MVENHPIFRISIGVRVMINNDLYDYDLFICRSLIGRSLL